MNSFRLARAAVRARPTAIRMAVQRRGFADAVPDKVCLTEEPQWAYQLNC